MTLGGLLDGSWILAERPGPGWKPRMFSPSPYTITSLERGKGQEIELFSWLHGEVSIKSQL